jgi:phosphoglycolate phosphatase-like HAD superfamily hydrolase
LPLTRDDLLRLPKRHEFLVGVDSDGCVFDTMEPKQKRFFHAEIVRCWGLERIERQVRTAAEFLNLYSRWRGTNRFPGLLRTFELLGEWDEVRASGVRLPDLAALRAYCASGLPMSNATLRGEVERTGDAGLRRVLDWSLAVNARIDAELGEVPPFPWARECLEAMHARADLLVVSQTPEEALLKEWRLHRLDRLAVAIAGQELGTKGEHLERASRGRYAPERILMVGDALGDRAAARQVGARFYPINPGREAASWERLLNEAFGRFLDGTFAGDYEARLAAEFESLLPSVPPWLRRPGA